MEAVVSETTRDLEIPRTSALVGLLSDHSPDDLSELRACYPDFAQLLQPGTTLGTLDADTRVLVELALRSLRVVQARAQPNLERLRTRLARAKMLRLLGGVVSTLTGAGLIAALVADAQLLAKLAAVVNFAVTLFALVASHLETPVYGGPGSLLESYETLAAADARAGLLAAELEACLHTKPRRAQVLDLVRRANELAADLYLAEKVL